MARRRALHLGVGDTIRFAGTFVVTVTDRTHESAPRRYLSSDGPLIRALAGPVDVFLRSAAGQRARACLPLHNVMVLGGP